MSETWSNEQWEAGIRNVFRRALLDATFRVLARTDARQAFLEANGVPAPEGVRFRFVEQLEEQVLVLPKIAQPFGTLSEIDVSRILHHSVRQQSIPPTVLPTA